MTTPARRQYLEIKARYPDALLMYQVGDFFEFFDADAHTAAGALQITLTSRAYGRDEQVPLAGVPIHALDTYAGRLVAQGFKVAICEQVEQPGRGLVKRAVTRVLTPGTLLEADLLPTARDNYLVAVSYGTGRQKGRAGLAFIEASTGMFACTEWPAAADSDMLLTEVLRLNPAEILLCDAPPGIAATEPDALLTACAAITRCPMHYFERSSAHRRLCRHFGVVNLAAFGCEAMPMATSTAGAILAYLERMHPSALRLVTDLISYNTGSYVQVDARTWSALEVVTPARDSASHATLLRTLDLTRTPMGARLLRRTLLQPSMDLQVLESRLDAIAEILRNQRLRQHLGTLLAQLPDLERLSARVVQGAAQPRELLGLAAALARIGHAHLPPGSLDPGTLSATLGSLDTCDEVIQLIERALVAPDAPDAPDARRMRRGYDQRLDQLITSIADSRQWIARLEARERERTGIKSLHVTFNRVFGYAIEITRANLDRVPAEYERRQTLATGERYVTADLREHESRVFQAEEQIEALERQLFQELLAHVATYHARLRATTAALAQLDVWLALADVAAVHSYVRPQLTNGTELAIRVGRHPVVEAEDSSATFVANDTYLGNASDSDVSERTDARILLLTGPNMAGKSTYLRQVAHIILLAQIGSFVPAQSAQIGIVDRIFTRVGAEDDLARGVSTFMREMSETAYILRHATERSLVVLDEVGRGTSTQDGLAIAQAVIEYLHDVVGARTLFATHFHELATSAEHLTHVRLAAMEAYEHNGELVFLHRLVPGKATGSYGVQVARLAGLPDAVTARASTLLVRGERGSAGAGVVGRATPAASRFASAHHALATVADAGGASEYTVSELTPLLPSGHALLDRLAGLNVAGMTPMEAINVLFSLQERASALLRVRDV